MINKFFKIVVLIVLCFCLSALHLQAASPVTERVSISSEGIQGNDNSDSGSMSASGRYIAFSSNATNLVPDDTNNKRDVFVHDRKTGETTRVSINTSGSQGNYDSGALTNNSGSPYISDTGQFVIFSSFATNLVQDDTNGNVDIFIHDRQTGQTSRVSISSSGEQSNGMSYPNSISLDGRFVAFSSKATNLVPDDTNDFMDVFVHDRQTGQTSRVSISSSGEQGNHSSYKAFMCSDGRFVVFDSYASNLVNNDTNGLSDIFLHDLDSGTTERVSVNDKGAQAEGPGGSFSPYASGDGRYVAFSSLAVNLVENSTGQWNIFLKDRETGSVTASINGNWNNQITRLNGISRDGNYLHYHSTASGLVTGDTNRRSDVFVRGPFLSPPPPIQLEGIPIPGVLQLMLKGK